ncbi:MAG: CvpA family protein [Chitinophagales bacterium]|nr:CvpA family protein [Chitinophagales bacterium]
MWIDIIWLMLAFYGCWKGWTNGLILSIFTLLAWGIGLLAAVKLSTVAATALHEQLHITSAYLPVISYVLVFVVIALVIYLVGKSLEKIFELAHIGFVNRISGVIMYVAVYTVLFSVFIWLLDQVELITPYVKQQSKMYAAINSISGFMIEQASSFTPVVKNLFAEFQTMIDKISKSIQQ